jgi:hypothetical protein
LTRELAAATREKRRALLFDHVSIQANSATAPPLSASSCADTAC